MIYFRKNKYKSRYSIKEGLSGYKKQQQGYQNAKRQDMDKKI